MICFLIAVFLNICNYCIPVPKSKIISEKSPFGVGVTGGHSLIRRQKAGQGTFARLKSSVKTQSTSRGPGLLPQRRRCCTQVPRWPALELSWPRTAELGWGRGLGRSGRIQPRAARCVVGQTWGQVPWACIHRAVLIGDQCGRHTGTVAITRKEIFIQQQGELYFASDWHF